MARKRSRQFTSCCSAPRHFADLPMYLGDIALANTVYFVDAVPPLFDTPSPVALQAGVARWWRSVNDAQAIKQTLAEIDAAFRGFLDKIGHT